MFRIKNVRFYFFCNLHNSCLNEVSVYDVGGKQHALFYWRKHLDIATPIGLISASKCSAKLLPNTNVKWKKNIFSQPVKFLVTRLPHFFIAKIPTVSHHCSIHASPLSFFFVFRGVIKGQLATVASCFQHKLKRSLVGFYWKTFCLRCYWNFHSPAVVRL